jgi:hypothetical protein
MLIAVSEALSAARSWKILAKFSSIGDSKVKELDVGDGVSKEF